MIAVLVLEDDDFMLDTLLGILEDAGYQATGAASSKEAIKSAGKSHFDLMVCDIRMEGPIDGISTVHYIKTHFLPQLLVLMMTGYADDLSPYRAMEAEVDAYIFKKDFKTSALLWAMENALRQRQQKTIFRKLFEPILSAPRRLLQTQDKARYDKALEKLDEGRLGTYRRFMVGIQSRQLEFRPALDIWDEFDKLERVYPILDMPPAMGELYKKYQALQQMISRRENSPYSPPVTRGPGQVDRAAFQILYDNIGRQQLNATELLMAEAVRRMTAQERSADLEFEDLYHKIWEKE